MSGNANAWAEHGTIWLSPSCESCDGHERTWCNSAQDKCEECGKSWTAFDRRKTRPKAERTKDASEQRNLTEQN